MSQGLTPFPDGLKSVSIFSWRRIKSDPILSEGMVMMTTPFGRDNQETVSLTLDLVNGWLFGIDDKRIKDDDKLKVQLLRYEAASIIVKLSSASLGKMIQKIVLTIKGVPCSFSFCILICLPAKTYLIIACQGGINKFLWSTK